MKIEGGDGDHDEVGDGELADNKGKGTNKNYNKGEEDTAGKANVAMKDSHGAPRVAIGDEMDLALASSNRWEVEEDMREEDTHLRRMLMDLGKESLQVEEDRNCKEKNEEEGKVVLPVCCCSC